MTVADDDLGESRRTVARRERRDAGTSSSELAAALMKLPQSSLGKLGLDEDLLAAVTQARKITAMVARRRAERHLAGTLRRVDLVDLATRLENVRTTGVGDPKRLHQAERWRTRLLDEPDGPSAFRTSFPTADHQPLSRLIAEALRERTTSKPPGAARALFRHITAVLDAEAAEVAAAAEDATSRRRRLISAILPVTTGDR